MYVDASVIVAILNREADAEIYKRALDGGLNIGIVSPITVYEASVSLARAKALAFGRKPSAPEMRAAFRAVRAFMIANGITEVAISPNIGEIAIETASLYGKAVGHRADLNFGDCFAYACAKAHGMPLLFKGADFTRTDILAALG